MNTRSSIAKAYEWGIHFFDKYPGKDCEKHSGKPSIEQFYQWRDTQTEVSIEDKTGHLTRGTISKINFDEDKGEIRSVRLNIGDDSGTTIPYNLITGFIIHPSVLIDQLNNQSNGIYLQTNNNKYFVDKHMLAEKLDYFRNLNLDGNQVDLRGLLTCDELKILLRAINGKKIILPDENLFQAMYLLSAASKISQHSLVIVAKNQFFDCATMEDYESILRWEHLPDYPVIQAFLSNIQIEFNAWMKREKPDSLRYFKTLKKYFTSQSKSLVINDNAHKDARDEYDKNAKSNDQGIRMLPPDISSDVISIFLLYGSEIETLELTLNSGINKIMMYLMNHQHLRSVHIDAASKASYTGFDLDHCLKLIEQAKSLVNITFGKNIKLKEDARAKIEKKLEEKRLNILYKLYKNLLFFGQGNQNELNKLGLPFLPDDVLQYTVKLLM